MWPVPDSKIIHIRKCDCDLFAAFCTFKCYFPRHFFQHDCIIIEQIMLQIQITAFFQCKSLILLQYETVLRKKNPAWFGIFAKINPVILKFQILLNRNLESRMSADTEIHLLIIGFLYLICNCDFFSFKFPCDIKCKLKRILFSCFR